MQKCLVDCVHARVSWHCRYMSHFYKAGYMETAALKMNILLCNIPRPRARWLILGVGGQTLHRKKKR